MREEGSGCNKRIVILSVIMIFLIIFISPINNYSRGDPSEEFIVQNSNDNYHKVFVDSDSGKFEINYINDIDGDFPEDWNSPRIIFSSNNELTISELDIYLSPDIITIWWSETVQGDIIGYYTFSEDYGSSWVGPNNGEMFISLKYAKFDPLIGEPPIPDHLKVKDISESYEYYIVQHSAISAQPIHDDVEALGGKFLGYIPYHAYLIWMNDSIKNEVEKIPYIRWIGYYQPAYKISSGLSHEDGIIELTISVFEEPDGQKILQKVNNKIEEMNGQILYDGSSNYNIVVRINAEKIDDLANIPEVAYIGGHGKYWPRELFPLHHIYIIDDGPNSLNISEIYNFTSVGWDDEFEDDLNRTWEPVWTVEGGVGKIIGDGYTVTFKATNPGKGKIVCTDEKTGFTSSLDIKVKGEVTEFPWIQVVLFLFLVSLIIIAIIQFRKRTITSE
jgi:hypothetical protein